MLQSLYVVEFLKPAIHYSQNADETTFSQKKIWISWNTAKYSETTAPHYSFIAQFSRQINSSLQLRKRDETTTAVEETSRVERRSFKFSYFS